MLASLHAELTALTAALTARLWKTTQPVKDTGTPSRDSTQRLCLVVRLLPQPLITFVLPLLDF
jgi:hypothetical protein